MANSNTPKRKQISVSLTPKQYEQFTELAFDLRERKDSAVLFRAIQTLGNERGIQIPSDDESAESVSGSVE